MGNRDRVENYFRKQLRDERERRRWSQSDLAKALTERGVPMYPTTIAKIEAGDRAVKVDEAAGIADALDVPLDWMLGRQTTGPAREIRYALRVLTEKAQDTIADLGAMIQALEDWQVDTFGITFDGKAELDADFKEVAMALVAIQARLVEKVVLRDLPEDHPVWQANLDQFHEVVSRINESVPALEPVTTDSPTEIPAKDANNET